MTATQSTETTALTDEKPARKSRSKKQALVNDVESVSGGIRQIDASENPAQESKKESSGNIAVGKTSKHDKTVRVSEDTVKKIDSLRGDLSRADYLEWLLEKELNQPNCHQSDVLDLGQELQKWFTTSKPENRSEIKETLCIDSEDIEMTEAELLKKASELSNIPVDQIIKEGRQYLAQKLITSSSKKEKVNKEGHGQGVAGSADSRLDEAYTSLKQMLEVGAYKPKNGKISLTAIANRGIANYNSAKDWAKRRGYTELL